MFDDLDDPLPPAADELMLSSVHARAARIRRVRRARVAGVAGAAIVVAGMVGLAVARRGPSSRKVDTATTAPASSTTGPSGPTTTPPPTTGRRGGGGPATPAATTSAPSAALMPGTTPPVPFSSVQLTLAVQPARFRWSDGPAVTLAIRNAGASSFTFTPWATCRTELSFTTASGKVTGYPLPRCLGLDGPVTLAPGQVVRVTKPLTELVPQLAKSGLAPGGYSVDVAVFDTSLSGQKLRSPARSITVDADAATSTTTGPPTSTTDAGSTSSAPGGSGTSTTVGTAAPPP
ncbi:MAG: hypothetical protein U0V73_15520 [Acidimicrobiia bacterium]